MIRVVSHGGGVQTMAMLVLAAQGTIDYRTFLFANVGDDSEDKRTLAYYREIAVPYAASHDIELVELHKMHQGPDRNALWPADDGRHTLDSDPGAHVERCFT